LHIRNTRGIPAADIFVKISFIVEGQGHARDVLSVPCAHLAVSRACLCVVAEPQIFGSVEGGVVSEVLKGAGFGGGVAAQGGVASGALAHAVGGGGSGGELFGAVATDGVGGASLDASARHYGDAVEASFASAKGVGIASCVGRSGVADGARIEQ